MIDDYSCPYCDSEAEEPCAENCPLTRLYAAEAEVARLRKAAQKAVDEHSANYDLYPEHFRRRTNQSLHDLKVALAKPKEPSE